MHVDVDNFGWMLLDHLRNLVSVAVLRRNDMALQLGMPRQLSQL